MPQPKLKLQGREVQEVKVFKYLGVLIDNELQWRAQAQKAAATAKNWALQCQRLTKVSTSVSPRLMWRLYTVVAIPKITYAADMWYTLPWKLEGRKKSTRSVYTL